MLKSIVESMWLRAYAESLSTMTFIFRDEYVRRPLQPAMLELAASWGGAEVMPIDSSKAWVKNRATLEPFEFFFLADPLYGEQGDSADSITLVVTRAQEPLSNVMLLTDRVSTNYVIRASPADLSKLERKFCKALEKRGQIPRGRTPMPNGQVPADFMDLSRSSTISKWDSMRGGRL